MNIRNVVRTLAVAALLAMTVVSVSAGQADARDNVDGDNGIRCYYLNTDGSYDFYLPGETITVGANGQIRQYRCGEGGQWIRIARTNSTGDVYAPAGGGVYAPASGSVYTPSTGGVYAPKAGGVLAQP